MESFQSRILEGILSRLGNPESRRSFIEGVGKDVILEGAREEILSSGHGTWAPLSPRRRRYKIARGYPLVPLIATRHLLYSLTPGREDSICETTDWGGTFGTSDPHAAVHQEGSAEGHVPARPFLVLETEDLAEIGSRCVSWLFGE